MMRLSILFAGLAVLLGSGCSSPQPPVPGPGFFVTSTYDDAAPDTIRVSIGHAAPRDRVTAVELVLPTGETVLAHRLDTETVTERRTYNSGYGGTSVGIGIGFGGGYGGGGFGGIGFGFPIGGGGSTETVVTEVRTEAEITVPDPADYRANWAAYKIRVTMTDAAGATDTTIIGPPRP